MIFTYKQRFKGTVEQYLLIKEQSKLSKNLYNEALYKQNQEYYYLGTLIKNMYQEIKDSEIYKKMTKQVACQTLIILERNIKSYFGLLQSRKLGACVNTNMPNYLKKDSYFVVVQPKQTINIIGNQVTLYCSKYLGKKYKTKLQWDLPEYLQNKDINIREIRFIPKNNAKWFEIEYVYKQEFEKQLESNNNFLSIDLGINNLLSCVDVLNQRAFIYSGKKNMTLLSKHKRRILLNYKLVDFLVKDLDISLFVFKCCSYISSLGVKRLF